MTATAFAALKPGDRVVVNARCLATDLAGKTCTVLLREDNWAGEQCIRLLEDALVYGCDDLDLPDTETPDLFGGPE